MNNSILTQEEIDCIRDIFKNNNKDNYIKESTKDALIKIGEMLPVSNRGGKGKDIMKIIKELRGEHGKI